MVGGRSVCITSDSVEHTNQDFAEFRCGEEEILVPREEVGQDEVLCPGFHPSVHVVVQPCHSSEEEGLSRLKDLITRVVSDILP